MARCGGLFGMISTVTLLLLAAASVQVGGNTIGIWGRKDTALLTYRRVKAGDALLDALFGPRGHRGPTVSRADLQPSDVIKINPGFSRRGGIPRRSSRRRQMARFRAHRHFRDWSCPWNVASSSRQAVVILEKTMEMSQTKEGSFTLSTIKKLSNRHIKKCSGESGCRWEHRVKVRFTMARSDQCDWKLKCACRAVPNDWETLCQATGLFLYKSEKLLDLKLSCNATTRPSTKATTTTTKSVAGGDVTTQDVRQNGNEVAAGSNASDATGATNSAISTLTPTVIEASRSLVSSENKQ